MSCSAEFGCLLAHRERGICALFQLSTNWFRGNHWPLALLVRKRLAAYMIVSLIDMLRTVEHQQQAGGSSNNNNNDNKSYCFSWQPRVGYLGKEAKRQKAEKRAD